MFCAKCGKEIDNDSTFCLFCGQKVGEPVINKKGIHPPASMKKISITKLVMGIAGCLVILSGVVLGIIKFTGGSNTKETAETISPPAEAQEYSDAKPQEDGTAETDTESSGSDPSAPVSDEEDMYGIQRWDLREMLQEFFGLHLKCYVNYLYGKCDTEPVNISTMLEHTGVIGYFTIDEGMHVVEDYNDDLFIMEMKASDLYSHIKKGGVYITCSVDIKEVNIPEYFRYYKGTDAVINAVIQLHYSVDGEEVSFWNDYALVSLVNCSSNPEEWLLQAVALINESDYLEHAGEYAGKTLVSENREQDSFIDGDWKQIYIDYINNSELSSNVMYSSYCFVDVNDDQIPEILLDYGMTDSQVLYYIAKDGSVNTVDRMTRYSSGTIRCGYGRQGEYGDDVYQYNSDSGMYDLVLSGYYYVDFSTDPETCECYIGNVACSMEAYNERFDAYLKEGEGVSKYDLDMAYDSEIPLVNAIRDL